jgi:hypothetical protein
MRLHIPLLGRAIAVASALALPCFAVACAKDAPATAGDAASGAKISGTELVHDFGAVTEGDSLKHTFIIKNEGSGPLVLDRVQTSCGCTVAEIKNKEIAPGATGQLDVTFNTKGRPGDQNKIITVLSNDAATPRLNLTVKAKVESLLAFDQPRFAASKTLHIGGQETMEGTVGGKLADQAKFAIEQTTGGDDVTAELVTKTEGDKQRQAIKVTVKGSKIGNFHGNVTLTTGLEQVPKLVFPFSWNVLGNVEVMPRALYFGIGGPPSPSGKDERIIQVKSHLADFKLKGAKVTSGPFKAQVVRTDAGTGYEVHVAVTDRDKLDKVADAGVELSTNDPIESTILVPITVSSARPRMMPGGPHGAMPPGPHGPPHGGPMMPRPMPNPAPKP